VSGIKENHRLNKMTVQTLLVTSVSMMVTTMPQMTQNTLVIHHRRHHHSMHKTVKMARNVRILLGDPGDNRGNHREGDAWRRESI
jgi:hypothetical protein